MKLELSSREVEALMCAILYFVGHQQQPQGTINLLMDVTERMTISAVEEAEKRRSGPRPTSP